MSYIFISYSHKDKDYAHKLHQYLFEHGFNAWIDDRIDYGSRWPNEVEKRVRECGAVILLMSSNSKQSDWVQSELHLAKQLNKTIYTFLLEGENWWHLHGIQYLDVRNGEMPTAKFIASLSKAVPEVKNVSIHIGGDMQGNIIVGDRNKIQSEPVGRVLNSTQKVEKNTQLVKKTEQINREKKQEISLFNEDLDLFRFIEIQKDEEVPYTFLIGKYPVTNSQYERFLNAPDFANSVYRLEFPKFDENCQRIGNWGEEGLNRMRKELEEQNSKALLPLFRKKILFPLLWEDKYFGRDNPNNPVVGISWYEANTYCEWLLENWQMLLESKANLSLRPQSIRLPLETEWQKAAGGIIPKKRYAWDENGEETISLKEIVRRANIQQSGIEKTTPVNAYPLGESPYGLMDMSGNAWEWQGNYTNKSKGLLGLRGGSWSGKENLACIAFRNGDYPSSRFSNVGFRVVCILP